MWLATSYVWRGSPLPVFPEPVYGATSSVACGASVRWGREKRLTSA